MKRRSLMAIALLVLGGLGCGVLPDQDAGGRVDHPPFRWEAGPPRSGGRRVALLVAADTYAEPNWNLPYAQPSAAELRRTLVDALDFPDADVVLLSGERVYPANIRDHIRKLSASLAGPGNVLLVHWVGHGFSIDGAQRFLTHPSDMAQGDYTNTLSYDELTAWIGDAKRAVAGRGGELSTALMLDTCRTRTSSAPGRLVKHVPQVDVEAFSAAPGNPAIASPTADISIFTQALCDALTRAHGARVSLTPALRAAVDATRRQGALITTGAADVTLLDRANLSLTVRALDQRTGAPIPSARVKLNGVERVGEAHFTGLAESAQGYDLQVTADGYLWRSEIFAFSRDQSGQLLEVPLLPEFVALKGELRLEGPGSVKVLVTGGFPDLIEGYHSTSVILDRSGPFELRVPFAPGPRALLLQSGGESLRRLEFNMDTRIALRDWGGTMVKVVDLGTQVLSADGHGAVIGGGVQAEVIGGIDVSFNFAELNENDFRDSRAWSLYQTVAPACRRRAYQAAQRDLAVLISSRRVQPGARPKLDELLHELSVAASMSEASERQRAGRLDDAIESLLNTDVDVTCDSRVSPVLSSWLLASAREHHAAGIQSGDQLATLQRLRQAQALERDCGQSLNADIEAQIRQTLEDWLNGAFNRALQDGTWVGARNIATRLAEVTDASDWNERIQRAAISSRCRTAYRAGLDALANGDFEAAAGPFETALASGCNEHYRQLIARHQAVIRDALFDRYNSMGAERDAAGEKLQAFEAWFKAWKQDPELMQHKLLALLEDPQIAWGAPAQAQAVRDAIAARERKREEEARDASPRSWIKGRPAPQFEGFARVGTNAQGYPEYDKHLGDGVTMRFVLLPAGSFSMGSPSSEEGRYNDEGPQHPVRLDAFLIAKTECTQAQWLAVMGNNPAKFTDSGLDAPVEQVSWNDIQGFERETGLFLPSEAQWEYAARAGSTGARHSELSSVGWHEGNNNSKTHLTGGKQANAFGLHDVLGNVWEWCEDTWHANYSGAPNNGAAWVDSGSSGRVRRGGCWISTSGYCRSAIRYRDEPDIRNSLIGFRPARPLR